MLFQLDIHVTKSSVVPTLAPTILNTTTGPILIAPSEKPVMDSVQVCLIYVIAIASFTKNKIFHCSIK